MRCQIARTPRLYGPRCAGGTGLQGGWNRGCSALDPSLGILTYPVSSCQSGLDRECLLNCAIWPLYLNRPLVGIAKDYHKYRLCIIDPHAGTATHCALLSTPTQLAFNTALSANRLSMSAVMAARSNRGAHSQSSLAAWSSTERGQESAID